MNANFLDAILLENDDFLNSLGGGGGDQGGGYEQNQEPRIVPENDLTGRSRSHGHVEPLVDLSTTVCINFLSLLYRNFQTKR